MRPDLANPPEPSTNFGERLFPRLATGHCTHTRWALQVFRAPAPTLSITRSTRFGYGMRGDGAAGGTGEDVPAEAAGIYVQDLGVRVDRVRLVAGGAADVQQTHRTFIRCGRRRRCGSESAACRPAVGRAPVRQAPDSPRQRPRRPFPPAFNPVVKEVAVTRKVEAHPTAASAEVARIVDVEPGGSFDLRVSQVAKRIGDSSF